MVDSWICDFLRCHNSKRGLICSVTRITLYALVLYDLQQGRFLHIKHKLLLFVLLSALSLVLGQSLKQRILSLHFMCFQEMSDNPQRKHSVPWAQCVLNYKATPQRWARAWPGKSPLGPSMVRSKQDQCKPNWEVCVVFVQELCELLICNFLQ